MNKFRSLLFAAILFLSSCVQKAEIPEVDYVINSTTIDFWRNFS